MLQNSNVHFTRQAEEQFCFSFDGVDFKCTECTNVQCRNSSVSGKLNVAAPDKEGIDLVEIRGAGLGRSKNAPQADVEVEETATEECRHAPRFVVINSVAVSNRL